MSEWINKLRKDGFHIDEDGFLEPRKSVNKGAWKFYTRGTYGVILRSGDKILKIQEFVENNNDIRDFKKEIEIQSLVYNCTKEYRSLTPKIFSAGKNWILMKNVPGYTITYWYKTDRKGVFQQAMRAYIKALQTIHRKCGIGHFDAHGSNAVYDRWTGAIKIIDWGFALPITQNNLTKEGMTNKYKESIVKKLGPEWINEHSNWMKRKKSNVVGQYAIEVLPYNTRFKNLNPRNNIVDFMRLLLSNSNNFPTSGSMTRKEFTNSILSPSKRKNNRN